MIGPFPPGADGDVAVIVHGGRDRGESFIGVAEQASGLRVVTYDRRGYGESPSPTGPVPFDRHVDDLIGVIGDAPASVVGHSWGGHVALAAAIRRPDLVRSVGATVNIVPVNSDLGAGLNSVLTTLVNGQPVRTPAEFSRAVAAHKGPVTLTTQFNNESERKVTVK